MVLAGESGVGKTCIVKKLTKGTFSEVEKTIGSNFSLGKKPSYLKVLQFLPKLFFRIGIRPEVNSSNL